MPRAKLTQTLADLHTQLADGDPIDDADREHLLEVIDDIRRVLQEEPTPPTLNDRLNEAVLTFEVSHPGLAALLGDIVRTLKQI